MKKICLFLVMLYSLTCFGQKFPNKAIRGSLTTLDSAVGAVTSGIGLINKFYFDSTAANLVPFFKNYPGAQFFSTSNNTVYVRDSVAKKWLAFTSGSGGGSSAFNGNRNITRNELVAAGNLGTSTIATTLEALLYPSQVPTSGLTATYNSITASSFDLELMSSGAALSVILNWTAGRQAATLPLSTVVVDGISESFTQPTQPGITGASQAGVVSRNVNKTFTNTVTTTDGKTSVSTISFNWYAKKYSGYTSNASPTSANIVAAAGGGVNGFFPATSANGAFNVVVTGSNQYVFYAYPTTYGPLTSINISGLESIGAFTRTTVAVTNAGGFVQNYFCYTTNNVFFNTTIQFISVN